MAIGAKASDIRIQFLIESLLLSFAGGVLGVLIGVLGAYGIQVFSDMRIAISSFSPGIICQIDSVMNGIIG